MNISLKKQSGIYTLVSEQVLPLSLDEAWDFFSLPKNLDRITPKEMAFEITNTPGDTTYAGQIITYKIEILPGIKSDWVTEITHLKDKEFFVDEQRFGPYAMWHHEHHFEAIAEDKTRMRDIVNFKLPMGKLGNILASRLVVNKVRHIFQMRYQILEEIFPEGIVKNIGKIPNA